MRGSDHPILLLGGTTEAYALAEQLAGTATCCITSLAGRTATPRLPAGLWRSGGFGGIAGLQDYIRQKNIRLVIDATHPFAEQITAHAIAAAAATGTPLLRLERPLWQPAPQDCWTEVSGLEQAAAAIPPGARVFLAIGRQHLAAFAKRHDASFLARMIEEPETLPPFHTLQITLGKPETAAQEIRFLQENRIDTIVCRNSGGTASYSKIIAARELHLPVIMINRKPHADIPTVATVEDAMLYLSAA